MNISFHRHRLKWPHNILSFPFLLGLCLRCIIPIIVIFPVLFHTLIANRCIWYMLTAQILLKQLLIWLFYTEKTSWEAVVVGVLFSSHGDWYLFANSLPMIFKNPEIFVSRFRFISFLETRSSVHARTYSCIW